MFGGITSALDEAQGWAASAEGLDQLLAYNAVERALLLAARVRPAGGRGAVDPRLAAAMDRVAGDLTAAWDIAELAAAAGMSASGFAHRFRAEVGVTPRRWVEDRRIERALHLLRSTRRPIAAIAAAVGFADPFHFAARVKARTGRPPSAWRDRRT